jgi:hypothetical protein
MRTWAKFKVDRIAGESQSLADVEVAVNSNE